MKPCLRIAILVAAAGVATAVYAPAQQAQAAKATPAEARTFINKAEARLLELWAKADRASWVQSTYITDDTEQIAAEAQKDVIAAATDLALAARRFDGLKLPADTARRLELLKLSLTLPAPADTRKQAELTRIAASLEGDYGKGKYCPGGPQGKCYSLNDLENIMAAGRDPGQLLMAWRGWHSISPPMRQRYQRFVELANEGARTLGFADMGALWRSKYDMPPEQFSAEVERLWQQVRPLYEALHAYVRARLIRKYGKAAERPDGLIPAHLLGNMWAQQWNNIYPLVEPSGSAAGYDLTELLKAKNVTPIEMVRYGERFFTSLGFDSLPKSFWERSMFTKPRDRDVVCHASAWDVDQVEDLRLKMCIEIKGEDLVTIHHELGHNFYQRAYSTLPPLYRDSANDGFHEAIGDTIALSVTPAYLNKIGLLAQAPKEGSELGELMMRALDKVAFLPFGLLIDQWRWKVFSGQIKPADYNKTWWELRKKYQGVAPPLERTEADFDPGAKYHVPANVPYTRYFLADILQFQFHRGLCRAAGHQGPLHRCSIYANAAAGAKLRQVLEMGKSRPWPEALKALTGENRLDATAILDYFAPLKKWLDEQNRRSVTSDK